MQLDAAVEVGGAGSAEPPPPRESAGSAGSAPAPPRARLASARRPTARAFPSPGPVSAQVVRELTGGIYFGQPKGFGKNDKGDRIGFNTDVYSVPEIQRIAKVGFETARKRKGKLCSVDKANVLEVSQLWREIVTEMHKDYKDVELSHMCASGGRARRPRPAAPPTRPLVCAETSMLSDVIPDGCAAQVRRQRRHAARPRPDAVRHHRDQCGRPCLSHRSAASRPSRA